MAGQGEPLDAPASLFCWVGEKIFCCSQTEQVVWPHKSIVFFMSLRPANPKANTFSFQQRQCSVRGFLQNVARTYTTISDCDKHGLRMPLRKSYGKCLIPLFERNLWHHVCPQTKQVLWSCKMIDGFMLYETTTIIFRFSRVNVRYADSSGKR